MIMARERAECFSCSYKMKADVAGNYQRRVTELENAIENFIESMDTDVELSNDQQLMLENLHNTLLRRQ